jgi:hypothetical protein
MRFSPRSHRHADEILNGKLALRKRIEDAIRPIKIPAARLSRPTPMGELRRTGV